MTLRWISLLAAVVVIVAVEGMAVPVMFNLCPSQYHDREECPPINAHAYKFCSSLSNEDMDCEKPWRDGCIMMCISYYFGCTLGRVNVELQGRDAERCARFSTNDTDCLFADCPTTAHTVGVILYEKLIEQGFEPTQEDKFIYEDGDCLVINLCQTKCLNGRDLTPLKIGFNRVYNYPGDFKEYIAKFNAVTAKSTKKCKKSFLKPDFNMDAKRKEFIEVLLRRLPVWRDFIERKRPGWLVAKLEEYSLTYQEMVIGLETLRNPAFWLL